MATKCSAITKSGSRCATSVLPGRPFCLFHDPEAAALRRVGSTKGGRGRATAERAKKAIPTALTSEELAGYLSALFRGVVAGTIEPKVGTAAATIAKVLFDVKTAVAVEDLEAQVAELHALVAASDRGRAA